jgi:hypothetical protein
MHLARGLPRRSREGVDLAAALPEWTTTKVDRMRPVRLLPPLAAILLSMAVTGCGNKTTYITQPGAAAPATAVTTNASLPPTTTSTATTPPTTVAVLPDECPADDATCDSLSPPVCSEDDQACQDRWRRRRRPPIIIIKDPVIIINNGGGHRRRRPPRGALEKRVRRILERIEAERAHGQSQDNSGEGIALVDDASTCKEGDAACKAAVDKLAAAEKALQAAWAELDAKLPAGKSECPAGDSPCKAAADKVAAAEKALDEAEAELDARTKATTTTDKT